MPNLPYQTYHTKPTILNLPCQTYHAKPTLPNLPCQTSHAKPNIPNLPCQTYHTKLTMPNFPSPSFSMSRKLFLLICCRSPSMCGSSHLVPPRHRQLTRSLLRWYSDTSWRTINMSSSRKTRFPQDASLTTQSRIFGLQL